MLLVQQPKLLLLDEPVAGMSGAGAPGHRRAAAGARRRPHRRRHRARHGVPAPLRPLGHGAARGQDPQRGQRRLRAGRSHGSARSTSAGPRDERSRQAVAMRRRRSAHEARDQGPRRRLRADAGAVRRVARGARRLADVPDGPQRRRQDDAAEHGHGPAAGEAGSVLLDGEDITKRSPYKRARRGIGYVPQGHQVFPDLTARENLTSSTSASAAATADAIDDALDVFPALRQMMDRPAGLLRAARPSSWPSPGRW